MTSNSKFILKLAILAVPYTVLSLVLHDGTSSGGIGGGSYDLSGMVYGLMLFAVTIIWLIWMSITYFITKTESNKKLHGRLIVIGLLALIATWFITPSMF